MSSSRLLLTLLLVACAAVSACRSVPSSPQERAVYVDLRQIVETRERGEWILDQKELEEARPKALQTICRVGSSTTASVADWIEAQIEAEGGPPAEQFAAGVERDDLDEELTLDRTRQLALYSDASRELCPFWLTRTEGFAGVHRPTDRFVLMAESAGGVSIVFRGDRTVAGAGGAGRLFAAYGFGHRYLVGLGGEIGGAAGLEPLTGSDEPEDIETSIRAAVPLLFRVHDLARVYDVEIAGTALTASSEVEPQFGLRASIGGGILTVRLDQFLPYFVVTAGYEILPWQDPPIHIVRIGTRFGVDFDP